MDKIKKMWCNLSLRKSIILYISAFVILAILLSAGTATLCNNATKTIESKYPPTGEKYYLTNENGDMLYAVWSIPVAIALVVIGSIISHKAFSKHQVR